MSGALQVGLIGFTLEEIHFTMSRSSADPHFAPGWGVNRSVWMS
ncbi:hypothetical protein ACVXG7_10080 [Enterobacter hormaechei]